MKPMYRTLALAFLLLWPLVAQAEESDRAIRRPTREGRVALVIGNAQYKSASPLKNPLFDAEDMAGKLKERDFKVILRRNATREDMEDAIREFGRSIKQDGVGLFFYAGHGMQVGGANYLIPTDADIQEENEVRYKAVDAGFILDKMKSAGSSLNIVILDACRNDPFVSSFRSSAKGLAHMDAPSGSLIVYATSPGRVAADGSGRNGTFTKHLLSKMGEAGVELRDMLSRVRAEVERETSGKQTPWELSSLKGRFYFTPAPQDLTLKLEPAPTPPSTGIEPEAWEMVKDSDRPGDIKDFLNLFPDGPHAALARLRLKMLEREQKSEPRNTTGSSAAEKQRGWLGVMIQDITPELAKEFGMSDTDGIVVSDIVADGPAAKAGFKRGDIIAKLGSKKVKNATALSKLVSAASPDTNVAFGIIRDGTHKKLAVRLGAKPEEAEAPPTPTAKEDGTEAASTATETVKLAASGEKEAAWGMEVQNITSELATRLGWEQDEHGVIITDVKAGGPAFEAHLRVGDLIREVNRLKIQNLHDYQQALKKAGKKESLLLLVKRGENTSYVALSTKSN